MFTAWLITKIIILLLLLWWLFSTLKKAKRLATISLHLIEAPQFSSDLIGCYVCFSGYVESMNQFESSLVQQNCAYYTTQVVAYWKTKVKKPGKGMNSHKKTILTDRPDDDVMLMSDGGVAVHIDMKEFYQKRVHLNIAESNSGGKVYQCPLFCASKSEKKFSHYTWFEQYLCSGDKVKIYGLLSLSENGALWLKPTMEATYATVLFAIPKGDKFSSTRQVTQLSSKSVSGSSVSGLLEKYHQQFIHQKKYLGLILGILFLYIGYFFVL
ncbi:MAG: hypothetical protein HON94_12985 [Methylococcales bacterium]|jgi:hypothetical protein|nr:hypothetical protein [Methylococcales bacterium]MBT7410195.1 hypothetical protein [Methylococcales bacterium]